MTEKKFLHTIERLGVRPDTCVFLDDFEGNVIAAEKLGIRGVLVGPDVDKAIRDLDEILSGR